MRNSRDKIKSYIGFAIKSRHIKYGVDDITKMKHANIILFSHSLAESSREKLMGFAKRTKSDIFELDDLFEIMGNENVKAIAVTENGLACAIKKIMTE